MKSAEFDWSLGDLVSGTAVGAGSIKLNCWIDDDGNRLSSSVGL